MTDKNLDKLEKQLSSRPTKTTAPLPKTIVVSELSDGTKDVLEYFGVEAPVLLNDFSCALEDALIESVARYKELKQKYEALKSKYE